MVEAYACISAYGGKVQSYLEKHSKEESKDNIRNERWLRFLHGLAMKINYFLCAGLQNKLNSMNHALLFEEKDPLVVLQY